MGKFEKVEMRPPPTAGNHGPPLNKLIAVAIDKDRGSQVALKWAIDNLLARGQTVILIHVKVKPSASQPPSHTTSSKSFFIHTYIMSINIYDVVDQPIFWKLV